MWNTLTITYENIHQNKEKQTQSFCQYDIFSMEENENIQTMFNEFHTILNYLSFLENFIKS